MTNPAARGEWAAGSGCGVIRPRAAGVRAGQAPVPALNTDSRTEEALPDTGTVPPFQVTFSESRSSGGVTSSAAGVAVLAPLI